MPPGRRACSSSSRRSPTRPDADAVLVRWRAEADGARCCLPPEPATEMARNRGLDRGGGLRLHADIAVAAGECEPALASQRAGARGDERCGIVDRRRDGSGARAPPGDAQCRRRGLGRHGSPPTYRIDQDRADGLQAAIDILHRRGDVVGDGVEADAAATDTPAHCRDPMATARLAESAWDVIVEIPGPRSWHCPPGDRARSQSRRHDRGQGRETDIVHREGCRPPHTARPCRRRR